MAAQGCLWGLASQQGFSTTGSHSKTHTGTTASLLLTPPVGQSLLRPTSCIWHMVSLNREVTARCCKYAGKGLSCWDVWEVWHVAYRLHAEPNTQCERHNRTENKKLRTFALLCNLPITIWLISSKGQGRDGSYEGFEGWRANDLTDWSKEAADNGNEELFVGRQTNGCWALSPLADWLRWCKNKLRFMCKQDETYEKLFQQGTTLNCSGEKRHLKDSRCVSHGQSKDQKWLGTSHKHLF